MLRLNLNTPAMNGYDKYHSLLKIEQEIGNNSHALLPLLEEYRAEYGYPANERCVRNFLSDRIYFHDSVIYTAHLGVDSVGFVQVYPLFTLLDLKKLWVLNDLFVLPKHRRKGIGKALLNEAVALVKKTNAKELILQAPVKADSGKAFCESLGLSLDHDRFYYKYSLTDVVTS